MLERIGFDPGMTRQAADNVVGRVLRVDRGIAVVLTEDGLHRAGYGAPLLRRTAADPQAAPCTGDWAVLHTWPDGRWTLERLLPRRTAVVRASAAADSHDQVLCANADLVAVVVGLHPLPTMAKVERLLALAWASGAEPVVVLTKADLVGDADLVAEDVAALAPGVPVLCTSTVTGRGLDELRALLEGRLTLALVGTSGHGKSSLANALVGAPVLRTREIRGDGRGRHTSVRRELVPLPGGGAVVDTPGLRGVGLTGDGRGAARVFAEVAELAGSCRFRDCGHQREPGCAVRAALEDGSLPLRRFESWQRLQREADWQATRQEARLRRSPAGSRGRRARAVRQKGVGG